MLHPVKRDRKEEKTNFLSRLTSNINLKQKTNKLTSKQQQQKNNKQTTTKNKNKNKATTTKDTRLCYDDDYVVVMVVIGVVVTGLLFQFLLFTKTQGYLFASDTKSIPRNLPW